MSVPPGFKVLEDTPHGTRNKERLLRAMQRAGFVVSRAFNYPEVVTPEMESELQQAFLRVILQAAALGWVTT